MSKRTARLVVAITLAVALVAPAAVAARPAGEETARGPGTVGSLVERWLGSMAALFAGDSVAVQRLSAAGGDEQDAGPDTDPNGDAGQHTNPGGAAGPETKPSGAGPQTDPEGDAGPDTDPDG